MVVQEGVGEGMPRLSAAQVADRSVAILDAAETVLLRDGFAAAGMAEVARLAGVSDGLIYRYYPGKAALRDAVLARFYTRILVRLEAAVAARRGFARRFSALIETHLHVLEEDAALCRLFISEVRGAAEYPGSELHGLNRRYTSVLLRLVSQGLREGVVRHGVDPLMVRDLLYGGMEHLAWRRLCGRGGGPDVARAAAQLADLLLHGMLTEQPGRLRFAGQKTGK